MFSKVKKYELASDTMSDILFKKYTQLTVFNFVSYSTNRSEENVDKISTLS